MKKPSLPTRPPFSHYNANEDTILLFCTTSPILQVHSEIFFWVSEICYNKYCHVTKFKYLSLNFIMNTQLRKRSQHAHVHTYIQYEE